METNFDIFGVENSESFSILVGNKIFNVTVLLLIYIRGTGNLSQQTSLQCLSIINVVLSNEDKILI